jgi:hypothetical protein
MFHALINIDSLLQLLVVLLHVNAHVLEKMLELLYFFPDPVLLQWKGVLKESETGP